MTNLSYNIYNFTAKFLKDNKYRFTTKEKFLVIALIIFFISYGYFILNIGDKNKGIGSFLSVSISLLFVYLGVKSIKNDNNETLIEYKRKYDKYYNEFSKEYEIFIKDDNSITKLIKHTISELESEINTTKIIKKNVFDKIVTILTPVQFIAIYFNLDRDLNKLIENSIAIFFVLIVISIVIYLFYKQIEYPIFNFSYEQNKKQNVLKNLKEFIEYNYLYLDRCPVKNKEVIKNKIGDKLGNMKYKLFYIRMKQSNIEVCNILWGVYTYEKEVDIKRHRVFWGIVEFKFEVK